MIKRLTPKVTININVSKLDEIEKKLGQGLDTLYDLKKVVQKHTYLAQARAVRNVSGQSVSFKGGVFVINRQTGTLARRFRVVFPNAMSGTLINEARYASYVEDGTREYDMKPVLMGKTIPLKDKRTGKKIFRRVTSASKGWIRPAQPARPFMREAAEYIEPIFARAVDEAVRRHFEKILTCSPP